MENLDYAAFAIRIIRAHGRRIAQETSKPCPTSSTWPSSSPLIGEPRSYDSWLRVALVVVAVAHRRLGPSSSATTSTVDRALPSSAVHARCWSRPTTTTRLPLESDCAACSAWSRHTTTVKNVFRGRLDYSELGFVVRSALKLIWRLSKRVPEGTSATRRPSVH